MSREDALRRLREITDGIDRDETEDEAGWWETSVGAEFGARKLSELESLIRSLT